MSISLTRMDEPNREIENKTRTIVNFLFQNKDFLPIIYEILRLGDLGKVLRDKEIIDEIFEDECLNNSSLEEKTDKFEEFRAIFIKNIETSEGDDEKLKKIKGRIFEKIIEKIFEEKHSPHINIMKYEKGCSISVRNQLISYKSRKTVDIAGIKRNDAEFYEIKVGPNYFDDVVLGLLVKIKETVCKEGLITKVGCISIADKDMLMISTGGKLKSKDEKSFLKEIEFWAYDDIILYK